MPTILKHWFDVVLEYQFVYGSKGGQIKKQEFRTQFYCRCTRKWLYNIRRTSFRTHEFCKNLEQTAYYAQMNFIEPIYLHGTSLAAGYTKGDIKAKAKTLIINEKYDGLNPHLKEDMHFINTKFNFYRNAILGERNSI